MSICTCKWSLQLTDFGITKNSIEEINMLSQCGLKVNVATGIIELSLTIAVPDPEHVLSRETWYAISRTLRHVSSSISETSFIRKIFDVVVNHIVKHNPIDYVFVDSMEFVDAEHDFITNVKNFISKLLPEKKIVEKSINSNTYPKNLVLNFTELKKPKVDKTESLKTLRSVDKIVKYHETNWKVNYTISMEPDETFIHKFEVCDYNDFDNSISVSFKSDSHFIKDLDHKLKDIIEELKDNLWTIDRFDKWCGDLDD